MKSYTDIEQSKKLAEILPIESADMWFANGIVVSRSSVDEPDDIKSVSPCWSLTALLSVLPFHLIVNSQYYVFSMIKCFYKSGEAYAIKYSIFNTTFYLHLTDFYNNPVDACYEMILKLHERNIF